MGKVVVLLGKKQPLMIDMIPVDVESFAHVEATPLCFPFCKAAELPTLSPNTHKDILRNHAINCPQLTKRP